MATIKDIKARWRTQFIGLSAKPDQVELQCIENNHIIAKFELIDPNFESGSKTYSYLICDIDGNIVDETSYEDLALCKTVLIRNAMNKPEEIQKIVDEYNYIEKGEEKKYEIYSGHRSKLNKSTRIKL